jgi:hypothetical protein
MGLTVSLRQSWLKWTHPLLSVPCPCFDDRILSEYWDVLGRPKFGFSPLRIDRLIHDIVSAGFEVIQGNRTKTGGRKKARELK